MNQPHFAEFNYHLIIKEHHLDSFSHVNNATYLQLFEEARWEFLNARGFGLSAIHASGIGPVVLEINIQFLKELRLREAITITSQMQSYDKKIGVMLQRIYSEPEHTLCCQATMTFGFFDHLIIEFDAALRTLTTPKAKHKATYPKKPSCCRKKSLAHC